MKLFYRIISAAFVGCAIALWCNEAYAYMPAAVLGAIGFSILGNL